MRYIAQKSQRGWNVMHTAKPMPLPSGGYRTPSMMVCEARDKHWALHIAECLNACRDAGIQNKESQLG